MRKALTIAGSDSCGGAGIQADIKTMTMNGVYAMSAITALTAQNTTGVLAVSETAPDFLKQQIEAVFADIRPDAVKIGMVSSAALIEVIADTLSACCAENVVVDPVMVATCGSALLAADAVETLKGKLFPMARLVTPNIPEAEVLSGMTVCHSADMEKAAKKIGDTYGTAVLVKGGHNMCDANDVLYENGAVRWILGKRVDNPNTHGTGCTLSSAITANLAKGFPLETAIEKAKEYITGALSAGLNLGKGSGLLHHAFALHGAEEVGL